MDTVRAQALTAAAAAALMVLAGCGGQSAAVTAETSADAGSGGTLNNYNITAGGTYRFSGSSDKQINISAKNEQVVIILDNAQITCADGPALYIEKAEKVTVTAEEGTSNLLRCTADDKDGSAKKTSAVFGKTELILDGSGRTDIASEYGTGIKIKGDITAESGTISVTSAEHGISAGGDFTLNGGVLDITSGGGSDSAAPRKKKSNSKNKDLPKGIGSDGAVSVNGGELKMDCAGDAVNSDGGITIKDGTINISCGDDALHSDGTLTVDGGTISVPVCYEGMEGYHVTVNGGDISIVSGDDGINSASPDGDSDTFMSGGDDSFITVNGGNTYIVSQGDGFDTNGKLEFNGGTIYVKGPSGSDNSPFDHDGDLIINGGEVTGFGSGMMAVPPVESGKQPSVFISVNIPGGKEIAVKDSDGNTVLSFSPDEQCDNAVISSKLLEAGKTYDVYSGDSLLGTADMTGTVAIIGKLRAPHHP